jgi:phosphoenolpyruvate carboxylase
MRYATLYYNPEAITDEQLADPSFRRQILVQYFILFQFLLHLTPGTASKQAFTGGMPKTFVIESSDETWVRETVSSIREELRRMPPDGPRFEKTVLSIITRESHYVNHLPSMASNELTSRRHGKMKDVLKGYSRSHPWTIPLRKSGPKYGKGDYHLPAGSDLQ